VSGSGKSIATNGRGRSPLAPLVVPVEGADKLFAVEDINAAIRGRIAQLIFRQRQRRAVVGDGHPVEGGDCVAVVMHEQRKT